jgi:hypothetical protein
LPAYTSGRYKIAHQQRQPDEPHRQRGDQPARSATSQASAAADDGWISRLAELEDRVHAADVADCDND